jgi:hypothetical protein
MRLLSATIICTALALPGLAYAQTKNVKGASAAGLCASSLEFVAGVRTSTGAAQKDEQIAMERLRNLFLRLPHFRKGEVEAYANAWSDRIARDLGNATTAKQKSAVASEVATIARGCQESMKREVNAAGSLAQQRRAAQPLPAQPQPAQPYTTQPQPAQPYTTQPLPAQPYTTEPMPIQPLETQPLIITPQ